MVKMKTAELIKYYREKRRISVLSLSKQLGVSRAYLYEVENGNKGMNNIPLLHRIAEILEIPDEEMFKCKEEDLHFEANVFFNYFVDKWINA